VSSGQTEVVDADLSGYFDSIPHAELMTSVARRVSDSALLHLLKMWLTAPVEETDSRGRTQRTTRNQDESRGTPQGAPLSPLLSNLYMRRFVLGWKSLGHEKRLKANIVNYADDFVICCRGTADEAMSVMRRIMDTLKLTVNETKTRIARLPDESFDFLGYTIGRVYRPTDGSAYLGTKPSRKKLLRFITALSERTARSTTRQPVTELIADLNQKIRGWANYFRLGSVTKAYHAVNRHACSRLRQWLCSKHQRRGQGYSRYPDHVLHQEFELILLTASQRRFSQASP
jgi:group II intron reverse transcriptase/maturase